MSTKETLPAEGNWHGGRVEGAVPLSQSGKRKNDRRTKESSSAKQRTGNGHGGRRQGSGRKNHVDETADKRFERGQLSIPEAYGHPFTRK